MTTDPKILTGQTQDHVALIAETTFLHREVLAPFASLKSRAAKEGMNITVASGYRSFAAQLAIWNGKCEGTRPILDAQGITLRVQEMDPEDVVFAILRWSALPGASRHHWGTDFDIYDAAAIDADYKLKLIPEEAASGGPFEKLSKWCTANLAREKFFRPYVKDQGGVSPEWWHISYRPLAEKYLEEMSLDLLAQTIHEADMKLKDIVLANLDEIYTRYVKNITA